MHRECSLGERLGASGASLDGVRCLLKRAASPAGKPVCTLHGRSAPALGCTCTFLQHDARAEGTRKVGSTGGSSPLKHARNTVENMVVLVVVRCTGPS